MRRCFRFCQVQNQSFKKDKINKMMICSKLCAREIQHFPSPVSMSNVRVNHKSRRKAQAEEILIYTRKIPKIKREINWKNPFFQRSSTGERFPSHSYCGYDLQADTTGCLNVCILPQKFTTKQKGVKFLSSWL